MTLATPDRLNIVILGLSITSSWGNGHATTYRGTGARTVRAGASGVVSGAGRALVRFQPRHARAAFGRTELYSSLEELRDRFTDAVREADFVIVGSYVPEGVLVGEWVTQTASGRRLFTT